VRVQLRSRTAAPEPREPITQAATAQTRPAPPLRAPPSETRLAAVEPDRSAAPLGHSGRLREAPAAPPPAQLPPALRPPSVVAAPPMSVDAPTLIERTAPADAAPPAGRPGAVSAASIEGTLAPRYPLQARRRSEEGLVLLLVEVLPSGKAGRIRVLHRPPSSRLVQAAIEAVRQARFTPAIRDGKAVASWLETPVRFRLAPR